MSGANAAYAVACVACEDTALFRAAQSIPASIRHEKGELRQRHPNWVDKSGFDVCEGDNLLLTLCWNCEQRRATYYDLPYDVKVSAGDQQAQLANPNLSKILIAAWPAIKRIQPHIQNATLLGSNTEARPVFKIELLSKVLERGQSTRFEYIGSLPWAGEAGRYQDHRRRFFCPSSMRSSQRR